MPLKRYEIRNEFALADPRLYNQPPNLKDDPEALLEGVAMSGFVGLLRQLGDLSEFASEIFHDLHEQVMTTSARGHGLMTRLHQLEADVPSVERLFLSQTSHSQFLRNGGIDWHTKFRMHQNQVTRGDMPRFIMDSYEECRGPPRLFLLDKFDIAGAGACLKRYSDPSFYKSSSQTIQVEGPREKKVRKIKRKSSYRTFGETPGSTPTSNPKLHELLSEDRIQTPNGAPPLRHVKLKGRASSSSLVNSPTGKSYMEKYLGTCSRLSSSPLSKLPYESPLRLEMERGNSSELIPEIREVYVTSPVNKSRKWDMVREQSLDDLNVGIVEKGVLKSSGSSPDVKLENIQSTLGVAEDRKEIVGDNVDRKIDASSDRYRSDNIISEVGDYAVDAFHSMEPESETETQERHTNDITVFMDDKSGEDSNTYEECQKLEAQYSASMSGGNSYPSDDGNDPFIEGRFSLSYPSPPSNSTETARADGDAAAEVHCFAVVDSGTSIQVLDDINSDISWDASTHPSRDDTSQEVLPTKDTEDGPTDNLSNGGLETPDSVILSAQSQYPETAALADASTDDQLVVEAENVTSLTTENKPAELGLALVGIDCSEVENKKPVALSDGSACESVEDRTPADWVHFNSFGNKEVAGAPLDFFSRNAKPDTSESASTEEAYSRFTHFGSKAIYEVANEDSVICRDALDTTSFTLESHEPSSSELFDNVDDSVCVARGDNHLNLIDDTNDLLTLRSSDRESESKQPAPSHLSDTTEGTVPSGSHQPLANAEAVKPFASFSPSDDEKPTQDPQNLNGETVQPCTNPFNTQPAAAAEIIRQDIPTPEENTLLHLPAQEGENFRQHSLSAVETEPTSNSLEPFRYASLPSEKEVKDPHYLQAAALSGEDGIPSEGRLVRPHNSLTTSNDGSEHGLTNGIRRTKIPRPTDAIIEAVASHDKSMLRKVTERALPQLEPKEDERNSLLEQIRNRSFSLKPAAMTRPSVQGPRTNLKLVAILEKANAIRQALAGSDDDEDEDSWSDS